MRTRSLLFIPAHDARKIEKGLSSEADIVIFDLEDAVAQAEKETARQILGQQLRDSASEELASSQRTSGPLISVRINGIHTADCQADIVCCASLGIRRIVLPKTERAGDILTLLEMWHARTKESLEIIALVETARGVEHAYEIAKSHPSVKHLALGSADLALDLGIDLDEEHDALLYTRSRLVIASRAAGIQAPIDAVYFKIKDEAGLLQQAQHSKKLGFAGKMIIHPAHIALVHQVWEAEADRLARDERIVQAFEQALQANIAAIQVDGQMVDYPVYQAAMNRLRNNQANTNKEE